MQAYTIFSQKETKKGSKKKKEEAAFVVYYMCVFGWKERKKT